MNKLKLFLKVAFGIILLLNVSCVNDLNTLPIDPNINTSATVYSSLDGYKGVMAKIYGGFANTGQESGGGNPDIGGIDEGQSGYIRGLWNLQELPTDEAVCAWGDPGIQPLNRQSYNGENSYVQAFYYRIYYQVALVNEFLRESTEEKLNSRGQSDLIPTIQGYRAEARFVRAFCYWQGIDLFGSIPFIPEEKGVGNYLPEQMPREDMYNWLQTELNEISVDLPAAGTREYGRVDVMADWMLKAKLYINAEVYTGTPQWDSTAVYAQKIIDAGGSLESNYRKLFSLDNNEARGIIFGIPQDADHTQGYGSVGFVVFSSTGGDMVASDLIGISGGWGGNRARPNLTQSFESSDLRGITTKDSQDNTTMFFNSGNIDVTNTTKYTDGYGVTKFKNRTSDNLPPSRFDWSSVDFPMFRLADAYLMYAEAMMWKAGGTTNDAMAVQYVNTVRSRVNASPVTTITKDFIAAELMREFYWEARRRTDLIRLGYYSGGDYVWQWKGGSYEGTSTPSFGDLYPIPNSELVSNPTLVQNPGY